MHNNGFSRVAASVLCVCLFFPKLNFKLWNKFKTNKKTNHQKEEKNIGTKSKIQKIIEKILFFDNGLSIVCLIYLLQRFSIQIII